MITALIAKISLLGIVNVALMKLIRNPQNECNVPSLTEPIRLSSYNYCEGMFFFFYFINGRQWVVGWCDGAG